MIRLGGGSPQTCRQCVFGVMGNSEMDHCCEVSFCILDKAQRDLFLGRKEGVLALVALLLITGEKEVFSYPISARNPAELLCTPLKWCPRNTWKYPLFPGPWDVETKVLISFKLS